MINLSTVRSNQKHHQKNLCVRKLLTTSVIRARSLVAKLKFAKQIAKERNSLRYLSDHQLRDIGMTRDQIGTEINRSILDLPHARFNELDYRIGARGAGKTRVTRSPKD